MNTTDPVLAMLATKGQPPLDFTQRGQWSCVTDHGVFTITTTTAHRPFTLIFTPEVDSLFIPFVETYRTFDDAVSTATWHHAHMVDDCALHMGQS